MARMTSDFSLLVFSLLLAIGLVYIKGQEKIQPRVISSVEVTVENLPPNMLLPPEPWLPPTTTVRIQGPRNFVDYVRADQTSFRIDYQSTPELEVDSPVRVLLTNEMFKTNLEPEDRSKISVIEEYIRPRQVIIELVRWQLDKPLPSISDLSSEPNQLLIPILRVEKRIPIVVPRTGDPPEGYQVESIKTDPSNILVTGRREAVDRIKSVSTPQLALEYVSTEPNSDPIVLQLQELDELDVKPVNETIRNVTVFVSMKRQPQGK